MMRGLNPEYTNKQTIEKIAYDLLREKYGNIPNIGEPELERDIWTVPINISYPRVFLDPITNEPLKTRFLKLDNVGTIKISSINGEILDAPRYYDVTSSLDGAFSKIQETVEKALVKVGAQNFSSLIFPEHIYTPVLDILSMLLTKERFKIEDYIPDDKETVAKYAKYVDTLSNIGLLRTTEGGYLVPGNLFGEMEKQTENANNDKKLSTLLSLFFEYGYNYIDSMRSVLVPDKWNR